jgi:HSP20 family protein
MAENKKAQDMQKSQVPAPQPADRGAWFDRWFMDWPRFQFLPELRRGFGEGFDPLRVEEFTEGDQMVVRAEMPGIDPDKDVDITVSDHTLHLRAERREEAKSQEKGRYRSEFRYGSFSRTIELPTGATDKDVKAQYKDGILEVRIPIDRQEVEAKKIPIERA